MSLDKPWNDVVDQLRPAHPDLDVPDDVPDDVIGDEQETQPVESIEADPADIADQHRAVPLPDDRLDDQPWL